MKSLPVFAGLLLATFLLAPLVAQEHGAVTGLPVADPVVEAIITEERDNGQVMQILDELVNGIGPRLTSSSRCQEACEWAAQRFEAWGLKNVRLVEWGTFPVGFDRGIERGRITQPIKRRLSIATNAWTAGTDGPVRARVMTAPLEEELDDAEAEAFRGAWVISPNSRPRFGSDRDDYASRLGRFLDEAEIAGLIRPTRDDRIRTGGNRRIEFGELPTRIQVNLARDDARLILQMLEQDKEVELELDLPRQWIEGPVPLYNVIGEIPGVEKPEELVIFGGHLDSWDGATGTQDNGTGTSTTMEAARLLAGMDLKPKRTIRFMLWTGEEQGLLGSRAYIQQNPDENDRISAVIVHDGGTNYLSGIASTPAMKPILDEVFAPVIEMVDGYEDEEIGFQVREVNGLPRGIGSDHDAYLSAGVPGFFWNQSGKTSYGRVHHTQFDTYDSAVEKYQRHSAKVVAIAAWRLANLQALLPRDNLVSSGGRSGGGRRLGVFLDGQGTTIAGVRDGSLAAQAGLKAKDVLLQIGETKLSDGSALRGALRAGGDRKRIVVQRGEQKLSFWFDWKANKAIPAEASGSNE